MAAVTFIGFCDDLGNFALDDKAAFRAAIKKLAGYEVLVTVKKRPTRQGSQAMRYYRGAVIPDIATACGYLDLDEEDCETVHQGLAWKLLRLPDGPMGEPRRRSTSKDDMSAEEFSKYLDQVILYAETNIVGCQIRRPEDVDLDTIRDREASYA